MRITMRMAAALGAFLSAGFLYAGAQCRLVGTVTDTAGAPIEGAAIVITTPKLGTFKLTLKTDGKGKYSTIMNDCTMPYHVSIEKEGFVTVRARTRRSRSTTWARSTRSWPARPRPRPAPGAAHAAAAAPSGSEQAVVAFNAGVEAVNAGDKAGAEAKFLEAVKHESGSAQRLGGPEHPGVREEGLGQGGGVRREGGGPRSDADQPLPDARRSRARTRATRRPPPTGPRSMPRRIPTRPRSSTTRASRPTTRAR